MGFKDYATDNQLKAVEHRGHDILVSASAGSGKTKVLVERIKDEILNYNFSISRMLIMTFTNAAAKEMRDRLIKVLQSELDKQLVENKNPQIISHLRKELTAVNVADISTIDAFCLKFLKKYYYAIDLDPNFRVLADETEKAVLREDVWEKVREKFYQKYEDLLNIESKTEEQKNLIQQYDDFFRVFVADRKDDLLTDVVYRVNDFANANEDPEKWLQSSIDNYNFEEESFTQTKIFTQIIKPFLITRLESSKKQFENYWFKVKNDFINDVREYYLSEDKKISKLDEKYAKQESDVLYVTNLLQDIIDDLSADNLSWDDLRKKYKLVNEFKFTKMFVKKRDYPDDEEYVEKYKKIKEILANSRDSVSELEEYLKYSDEQLKLILAHAQSVVSLLIDLVKQFREEYLRVKLQRHVLEFSDLEYFTLKILRGNSEVQQKIRQELKSHYVEIMIDEYQDTNGVQEAIVQAIANHNVFMVGDVKQSIYRFRQADPALFMHKYQTFNQDEEINDLVNGELIVLQDNFRSVKNVADLTNLIFMQLMDQDLGEMVYDQKAFLKSKNPVYKTGFEDLKTNIMIYLTEKNEESDLELDDKTSGQLTLIAKQINDLIDNEVEIFDRDKNEKRKIRYSDIAILSSSHQDSLLINENFKEFGIPTNVDETNNYFKKTEIQIMVSLLKIIDNPHQDIPLVAVLRSPMYNFDENELAYLRINCPSGDFYRALTNFQGRYEYGQELKPYSGNLDELYHKVKNFTDNLTTFRVQAKRSDIATLIWNIYTTTGFLDFVGGMPNGNQRQNNLHALYERASEYEKTSFKGLFQFIRFVERMAKQQNDLPEMKSQANEDAVTFMTIHKSKGLEFPVVFVMDLNKQFNLQDLNQNCILDDHLGIGLNIIESSKVILKRDVGVDLREDDAVEVQEKTPIYAIIKDKLKRKALAEEMRKLYVALTRAEQRIYLVGSYKSFDDWEQEWDATNQNDLVLDEALRLKKSTYMNWIGNAFGRLNSLSEHTKVFEFEDGKIQSHGIGSRQFNDHLPAKIVENTPNYEIELWTGEALAQFQLENTDEVKNDSKDQTLLSQDISQTLNAEVKEILDFKDENIRLSHEPAYQAVTDIKGLFNNPDNDSMSELNVKTLDFQAQKQPAEFFAFSKPNFMTTRQQVSGAKIGSATHLLFQKLDLTRPINDISINDVLHQQILAGSITSAVAKQVDIDGVKAFYQTEIGKKLLLNNQTVKREAPFSLLLPVQRLIKNFKGKTDKKVLVHGIIDCYFEDLKTGEIYLLDYKTDATAPQQIKDEYQGQLNLYAMVLEQITGKKVKQKYLYSVKHRQLILVD